MFLHREALESLEDRWKQPSLAFVEVTWTLADLPRARTWAKVTEFFSYGIGGGV